MTSIQTGAIVHLTDATFESDVELGRGVAMVKFTADWCPPCKVLSPILHELSGEFAGRVQFFELDTDVHQRSAVKYGVRGLPTTIIYRDGHEVARLVGLVPAAKIRAELARVLS